MPDLTGNMQLKQPHPTETVNIADINYNTDKLDTHRHDGGAEGLAVKAVQNGSQLPGDVSAGQLYVATNVPALYFANGSAWTQVQNGPVAVAKIQERVLTGNEVVTFSAIPATYRHLEIRWQAQYNGTGSDFLSLLVQFNNDASANYQAQYTWATGNSQGAGEQVGWDCIGAALLYPPYNGGGVMLIPDYRGGSRKGLVSVSSQ